MLVVWESSWVDASKASLAGHWLLDMVCGLGNFFYLRTFSISYCLYFGLMRLFLFLYWSPPDPCNLYYLIPLSFVQFGRRGAGPVRGPKRPPTPPTPTASRDFLGSEINSFLSPSRPPQFQEQPAVGVDEVGFSCSGNQTLLEHCRKSCLHEGKVSMWYKTGYTFFTCIYIM